MNQTSHRVVSLLQASQITLLRHINSLINLLPVPHQMMTYHDTGTDCREDQYRDKMEDILTDITWLEMTFQLTSALLQYLVSLPQFPWQPTLPDESTMDVARFSVFALEVWSCSDNLTIHSCIPSLNKLIS